MNDASTSNEIKQQLSALMDGELDTPRARFLLRRLSGDRPLEVTWSQWHLARACLRGESAGRLRADFASTISLALEQDAVPRRAAAGQALKWVGGLAVAASVAVATLLAVPLGQPPASSQTTPLAAVDAPVPTARVAASSLTERDLRPSLGSVAQTVAASTDARSLAPALRLDPQLHGYLQRHNAALRSSGDLTYLPLVPVVAPARPWSMLPVATSDTPTP